MSRLLSGDQGSGRLARSPRSPGTERERRACRIRQHHPRGSVLRRVDGRMGEPGALGL